MNSQHSHAHHPGFLDDPLQYVQYLADHLHYRGLFNWVLGFYALGVLYCLTYSPHFQGMVGSIAILTFSIIPLTIWIRSRYKGLPVFQTLTLPFVWCYALPLVHAHSSIEKYSPDMQFQAALTICLFLIVATAAWLVVFLRAIEPPGSCRSLPPARKDFLYLIFLAGACFFNFVSLTHWIAIPWSIFPVLRALLSVVSIVSIFMLSFDWGSGKLAPHLRIVFLVLLLTNCYLLSMSFILNRPVTELLLAVIGMGLGKRRPPFLFSVILVGLFVILHYGKYEMRQKYWIPELQHKAISVPEIGSRLVEWYGASFKEVFTRSTDIENTTVAQIDQDLSSGYQEKITILNRLSLIHMFLLTYSRAGEDTEYLGIKPYLSIPLSLIPRFLYPDKPYSHAGTFMLNIHYGLQTEDQVLQTTIGWGMLAEAWAAGGLFGIVVLALFLGGLLGEIGRLSIFVPMFSFRTFVGLTFMGVVIHTELTMGVLTAVLFQSLIVLFLVSMVFMRTYHRGDYSRL